MLRTRLTGLDGLRAIAVLAVLIFHADARLLPGGFLGVDLFFVISGYLITRGLLAELGRTGGLHIARFYLRRAVRLLPALLVLLVAVTAAGTLVWRDESATLRPSVLATLGYAGNWWLIGAHQSYFVASGRPPMLQHLWSLAIEEQFYLIWPFALLPLAGGRRGWWRRLGRAKAGSRYPERWPLPRRFGRVATWSAVLAAGSATLMAVLAIRSDVPFATDSSRVYFGSDTHSMGLLLGASFGALAARLEFQPRRSWRVRRWCTDLIGLTALVVLAVLFYRVDEFSAGLYRGGFLAVSAVAVALVATVARTGSRLGRLLDRRPLRWLGDRSYAIYLWHWPVIVVSRPGVDLPDRGWLVLGIRLLVPLALASASYAFIERPARRLAAGYLAGRARRPLAGPRPRLVPRLAGASGLAMALLVLVLLVVAPGQQPTGAVGAFRPAAVTGAAAAVPTDPPASAAAGAGRPADVRPGAGTVVSAAAPASSAGARPAKPAVWPPSKGQPMGLSAFGDSVMLGARAALAARFSSCQLDAVEGRQPYLTLQDVRGAQAAGRLAPLVAIHTGNNGVIRPADLASTLAALRDRQRVVLLTDRVSMDWQGPNNATIRRVAKGFSNVVVLDWYARSNGNRSWFYADGLHLRPDGALAYARLIATAAG